MQKYSQMKVLHRDLRLQYYMYTFMYVYPQTMPLDYHFIDAEIFVVN